MRTNLLKLTGHGIAVAAFAAALALALPAQADFKIDQSLFARDCDSGLAGDIGDGFIADGVAGTVTIPSDRSLEVFNFGGGTGVITQNCTVTLVGEDSELNLAEGTDLAFCDSVDAVVHGECDDGVTFYDFDIEAMGAGFEI